MADFNCRLDLPEVSGLATAEWTVGREAFLSCTGPWPEFAADARLRFELSAEQSQALKILSTEKLSSETLKFKITSYRVGNWDLQDLMLTDGQNKINLGQLKYEVKSVLDPLEPRQEPYGSLGPLSIGIPLSWWIVAGGSLAIVCVLMGVHFRKRFQRKRLIESLRRHDSALSPISEFHQTLRRLRRDSRVFYSQEFDPSEPLLLVEELEKTFRLFFLRRFQLPAYTWSDRALIKALSREHRQVDAKTLLDLKKILREFAAAKIAQKVEARDVIQLSEQSRRLAESLDKAGGAPK